ncbi:hypothetical protein CYMTET_41355 [Cymbomonas tetramitiformis]|uniref:Uncharacterized protein n=1 Tax=Cymbomonas tetramitiformis TaxID=36881 RepID=A0AAE0C6A6_9CHLO|nr:hypothetical protein CYMTET_41355 [Cymbomonas tetramitiformis]
MAPMLLSMRGSPCTHANATVRANTTELPSCYRSRVGISTHPLRQKVSTGLWRRCQSLRARGVGQQTLAQGSSQDEPVSSTGEPARKLIVFEFDGVVVDVHEHVHLAAFNKTFKDLGLDCAHWSSQVYLDLVLQGGGSAEGMLTKFFGSVGWPTFLATSDQDAFVKRIEGLKNAAVPKLLEQNGVPMQAGAQELLQELADLPEFVVAMVTGTASDPEDRIAEAVLGSAAEGILLVNPSLLCDDEDVVADAPSRTTLQRRFAEVVQARKAEWASAAAGGLPSGVVMDSTLLGTTSQRSQISASMLSAVNPPVFAWPG